MKLTAEVDGEQHSLELNREGARVVASVDGRSFDIEVHELGTAGYLLSLDGKVYECFVASAGGARSVEGALNVHARGRIYSVNIHDPKRLRGAGAVGGHDAGRAEVMAPMPGKIVRVLVETGQKVEKGDGLIVVEAMKMQNELKSPREGTVTELHAAAGATVNSGEVLVVVV
jgi:biotin carboxyl carrier protein